jgi:hypothetical protein
VIVFIGDAFADETKFELEERGLARFLNRPIQNEDLMQVFTAMANEAIKNIDSKSRPASAAGV